MSALPVSPNLGEPFFSYTMKRVYQPERRYSAQDIEFAFHTLVSGDFEKLSEETLETILDIVYYPEHLCLMVNARMSHSLFEILLRYPEGRSVSRRSIDGSRY